MNDDPLRHALSASTQTHATVSDELHQRVMRSVRLASGSNVVLRSRWSLPAWGLGMTATAIAIFYLAQTEQVSTPNPDARIETAAEISVEKMLTSLQLETALPEQELRKELERLKSDLKRFDIRS